MAIHQPPFHLTALAEKTSKSKDAEPSKVVQIAKLLERIWSRCLLFCCTFLRCLGLRRCLLFGCLLLSWFHRWRCHGSKMKHFVFEKRVRKSQKRERLEEGHVLSFPFPMRTRSFFACLINIKKQHRFPLRNLKFVVWYIKIYDTQKLAQSRGLLINLNCVSFSTSSMKPSSIKRQLIRIVNRFFHSRSLRNKTHSEIMLYGETTCNVIFFSDSHFFFLSLSAAQLTCRSRRL